MNHKFMRRFAILYLCAVIFGIWGFAAGRYEAFPYGLLKRNYEELERFVEHTRKESDSKSVIEEITKTTVEKITDTPYSKLKRNRFPGTDGFVFNSDYIDSGYLLFSGLDANTNQHSVKLIKLSNQEVINTWYMNYDVFFRDKPEELPYVWTEKSNTVIQNPLLLDDGSLIFHTGQGPLVRIDACSSLMWVNYEHFHHSINRALNGGYWVPIVLRDENSKGQYIYQLLKQKMRLDGIALVNMDGKIEKTYNIAAILEENGYSGLLYGMGDETSDKIHLNSIYEADSSGRYWNRGDLLLSLRNKSAVLILRPLDKSIIWLKVGPWQNQHDARFLGDHSISIFGNQVDRNLEILSKNGVNEIFIYDFVKNMTLTPYTEILESLNVMTKTEGAARILDNGMVFIEETNSNRLLMLDKDMSHWEYVNVYNNELSGAVSWSRYYYEDELENLVKFSSCE